MNNENIVNNFKDNFWSIRKEKIAIYGLGEYTQEIIEHLDGTFQICALLDGYQDSGSKFGKRIISLQKAIEEQIKIIVIVARANSTKIIFDRIKKECIGNQIYIYDLNGEELTAKKQNADEIFSFPIISFEELRKQVDRHKIISFDIFDTLVCRRTLVNSDVFEAVYKSSNVSDIKREDYIRLRTEAEKNLNIHGVRNIYEIYDYVFENSSVSRKNIEILCHEEIEFEKHNIIARDKMLEIYNYAKESGKQIFLVSDMYFTKKQIEEILVGIKIHGYEDVFISCEHNTTKSKELFKVLLERIQENPDAILHIGDSKESDIDAAQINGIHTFKTNSIYEMMTESIFRNMVFDLKYKERCLLGLSMSQFLNNPFKQYKNGKVICESDYEIAYTFFGPVISSLVLWMIDRLRGNQFTDILFASRDGWLIQKLYETAVQRLGLQEMPRGHYFYTSRIAAVSAMIKDTEDIKYVAGLPYSGGAKEMLRHRFGLEEKEIQPYVDAQYEDDMSYILKHSNQILLKSKQLRRNYHKYINNLHLGGNISFFDFVSTGTCQVALNKLMEIDSKGFYFIRVNTSDQKKAKLDIEGFIDQNSCIYENYFLLEYIVSSSEPTLLRFDEKGEKVLGIQQQTEYQLGALKSCQRAIIDYFDHLLDQNNIYSCEKFPETIFKLFNSGTLELGLTRLKELAIQDDFCKRSFKIKN